MYRLFQKLSASIIATIILTTASSAQTTVPDNNTLASEGARLGRAYNAAMKAGDAGKQNEIINEFNSILITLKKQEQADILTNAFTNCTVPITKPETDALLYSRALMNAYAKGDSIAIEDATDIAGTVKNIYSTERTPEQAELYARLYDCAVSGARLGKEYSEATDTTACNGITAKADEIRSTVCAGDSLSTKIFNDSFDYYSIRLTTPEDDAAIYSEKMKQAGATGNQSQVNAVARMIGYVYEHYSLERSKEDADRFSTLTNELIDKERK